jgi:hypothetical protein
VVSVRRAVLLAVVSVLVAATIYELVIAVIGVVGAVSGEAPSGEPIVYLLSLLAIFLGALLALSPSRTSVFPLAPAAAAFVTARFYTADPYYAPTLRRYHDAVVLGAPVYDQSWPPETNAFVPRNHDALAARPLWYFTQYDASLIGEVILG